jgi:hypothetical protein
MKKGLLLLCLAFPFVMLQAQTVIFSDNFDSYTAGQLLCTQNNTDWTTWSNAPGTAEDAYISTEQAVSGSNSLKIEGTSDIMYLFNNRTTGVFDIDFNYYVPSSGNGAYFNIQHYTQPGQDWAFECRFHSSGMGYLFQNGELSNFSFPADTWFPIKVHIDLDNDSLAIFLNGESVETWPFSYTDSGDSGICQLGLLNFFAGSAMPNTPGTYYVDDFVFTQLSTTGIEAYSNNSSIRLYPNPATDMLNIRSDNEILKASIMNIDGQVVKSISGNFNNIGISDLSNGLYFVNICTENGTETLKFIKK